jgi:hypothetical protein
MVTVIATLESIIGLGDSGTCIFRLGGFGASVPTVSGAVISTLIAKAVANSAGVISQALVGNDVISPPGTFYVVAFFNDQGGFISEGKYRFTGSGTQDLSTSVQLQV